MRTSWIRYAPCLLSFRWVPIRTPSSRKTQTLSVVRAGAAALKITSFQSDLGDAAPGWVLDFLKAGTEMVNELGDHVVKLKTVTAKSKGEALNTVAKLKPFKNKDSKHWLDESDYLVSEDTDEFLDFLGETLFTVSPAELQQTLTEAVHYLGEMRLARDVFAKSPSDEEKKLVEIIDMARGTKAENIACALLKEHRLKPIRLKRTLKDHGSSQS